MWLLIHDGARGGLFMMGRGDAVLKEHNTKLVLYFKATQSTTSAPFY